MYKEMVKAKLKIAKNHIFSCTKSNRKDIQELSTWIADLPIYKEESASIINPKFGESDRSYYEEQCLIV
jgi:hypothetical protein